MAEATWRDANGSSRSRGQTDTAPENNSTPTIRDQSTGATGQAIRSVLHLPSALASQWRIERELISRGAEADLILVINASGERRVAKIYRAGIEPKTNVIERVGGTSFEHVVRLFDHGQSDGRSYELLEYVEHGSLEDLIRQEGLKVPEQRVREILTELAAAIDHLHRHEVVHRDIKPSNILVRALQPLDLVLADFGIASVLGQESRRFTTGNRTIAYSAPETAAGEISQAADWWPLGIMLVEMLTGHHPFAGAQPGEMMNDQAIMSQLFQMPVDRLVDGVGDPWCILCRGLLRREARNRWGNSEIERWLSGDPTLRVVDELAACAPDHPPFFFASQKLGALVEIAQAFREKWLEARKVVERGHLLDWVKDDLRDNEWRQFLSDLDKDCPDLDERVFRIILKADPRTVPVFDGYHLDPAGLFRLANDSLAGAEAAKGTLTRLFDRSILQTVTAETGVPAYGLLQGRWATQLDVYGSQVHAIVRAGAPEAAINQAIGRARATMLLSVLPDGETYVGELRKLAQKHAKSELRDCDWFRALGDPQRATAPTAFLITLLAPHAEAPARAVQKRREDERAAQEAAERRLLEEIAATKRIEDCMTEAWQCIVDIRQLFGHPSDWRLPDKTQHLHSRGRFHEDNVERLARYSDGSPCSIGEAGEHRIKRAKKCIAEVRQLTPNDKVPVRNSCFNFFPQKSDFKEETLESSVSHTENQLLIEERRLDQLWKQGWQLFEEGKQEFDRQSSKRFFRDYSTAISLLERALERGVFEARPLLESSRKK